MFNSEDIRIPSIAVKEGCGVAIDVGGTLCKIVYKAKVQDNDKETLFKCITGKIDNIKDMLEYVKSHTANIQDPLMTTGIKLNGPIKQVIEDTLGVKTVNGTEMVYLMKTFMYLINARPKHEVVHPTPLSFFLNIAEMAESFSKVSLANMADFEQIKQNDGSPTIDIQAEDIVKFQQAIANGISNGQEEDMKPYLESDQELFPCFLACIGSGISFTVLPGPNEPPKFVGGTTRGGKCFLGLCSLILDTMDYDEVMNLASKGDASKLSVFFKDLKTGEADDSYSFYPDSMIAFDLGKVAGSKEKYRKEDLAAALVYMLAGDIGASISQTSRLSQCKRAFICGGMVKHPLMRERLLEKLYPGLAFTKEMDKEYHFLQHITYLPSIGLVLK